MRCGEERLFYTHRFITRKSLQSKSRYRQYNRTSTTMNNCKPPPTNILEPRTLINKLFLGPFSFHVEGLSRHFLADADGIRAIVRAVKNILDYGSDARLRTLCKALDAYRERELKEREAATSERDHAYEVQTQPRKEQQRRGRPKAQSSSGRRRLEHRRKIGLTDHKRNNTVDEDHEECGQQREEPGASKHH
jgi:hypothetical protein